MHGSYIACTGQALQNPLPGGVPAGVAHKILHSKHVPAGAACCTSAGHAIPQATARPRMSIGWFVCRGGSLEDVQAAQSHKSARHLTIHTKAAPRLGTSAAGLIPAVRSQEGGGRVRGAPAAAQARPGLQQQQAAGGEATSGEAGVIPAGSQQFEGPHVRTHRHTYPRFARGCPGAPRQPQKPPTASPAKVPAVPAYTLLSTASGVSEEGLAHTISDASEISAYSEASDSLPPWLHPPAAAIAAARQAAAAAAASAAGTAAQSDGAPVALAAQGVQDTAVRTSSAGGAAADTSARAPVQSSLGAYRRSSSGKGSLHRRRSSLSGQTAQGDSPGVTSKPSLEQEQPVVRTMVESLRHRLRSQKDSALPAGKPPAPDSSDSLKHERQSSPADSPANTLLDGQTAVDPMQTLIRVQTSLSPKQTMLTTWPSLDTSAMHILNWTRSGQGSPSAAAASTATPAIWNVPDAPIASPVAPESMPEVPAPSQGAPAGLAEAPAAGAAMQAASTPPFDDNPVFSSREGSLSPRGQMRGPDSPSVSPKGKVSDQKSRLSDLAGRLETGASEAGQSSRQGGGPRVPAGRGRQTSRLGSMSAAEGRRAMLGAHWPQSPLHRRRSEIGEAAAGTADGTSLSLSGQQPHTTEPSTIDAAGPAAGRLSHPDLGASGELSDSVGLTPRSSQPLSDSMSPPPSSLDGTIRRDSLLARSRASNISGRLAGPISAEALLEASQEVPAGSLHVTRMGSLALSETSRMRASGPISAEALLAESPEQVAPQAAVPNSSPGLSRRIGSLALTLAARRRAGGLALEDAGARAGSLSADVTGFRTGCLPGEALSPGAARPRAGGAPPDLAQMASLSQSRRAGDAPADLAQMASLSRGGSFAGQLFGRDPSRRGSLDPAELAHLGHTASGGGRRLEVAQGEGSSPVPVSSPLSSLSPSETRRMGVSGALAAAQASEVGRLGSSGALAAAQVTARRMLQQSHSSSRRGTVGGMQMSLSIAEALLVRESRSSSLAVAGISTASLPRLPGNVFAELMSVDEALPQRSVAQQAWCSPARDFPLWPRPGDAHLWLWQRKQQQMRDDLAALLQDEEAWLQQHRHHGGVLGSLLRARSPDSPQRSRIAALMEALLATDVPQQQQQQQEGSPLPAAADARAEAAAPRNLLGFARVAEQPWDIAQMWLRGVGDLNGTWRKHGLPRSRKAADSECAGRTHPQQHSHAA